MVKYQRRGSLPGPFLRRKGRAGEALAAHMPIRLPCLLLPALSGWNSFWMRTGCRASSGSSKRMREPLKTTLESFASPSPLCTCQRVARPRLIRGAPCVRLEVGEEWTWGPLPRPGSCLAAQPCLTPPSPSPSLATMFHCRREHFEYN